MSKPKTDREVASFPRDGVAILGVGASYQDSDVSTDDVIIIAPSEAALREWWDHITDGWPIDNAACRNVRITDNE